MQNFMRAIVIIVLTLGAIAYFRHDYTFITCGENVYQCNLRNGKIENAAYQGRTFIR